MIVTVGYQWKKADQGICSLKSINSREKLKKYFAAKVIMHQSYLLQYAYNYMLLFFSVVFRPKALKYIN